MKLLGGSSQAINGGLLFLTLFLLLLGCIPAHGALLSPKHVDLFGAIKKGGPNYSIFLSLLRDTKLDILLDAYLNKRIPPGKLTIFAPTNKAFKKLPKGTLEKLTLKQKQLILFYHLIPVYLPRHVLKNVWFPFVSTFASFSVGPGRFLLSLDKGFILTSTKAPKIAIGKTIYNIHPLVIYSIDHILLPNDLFKF